MEASHIVALFLLMVCACASAAIPSKNRREELAHLANILGKIKNLERVRQSTKGADWEKNPSLLDSDDDDDTDPDPITKDVLSRRSGFAKRQGDWSYDYGLGGGRFGKRANYGDYGIGGGRFGRDVDHVDPSFDAVDTSS